MTRPLRVCRRCGCTAAAGIVYDHASGAVRCKDRVACQSRQLEERGQLSLVPDLSPAAREPVQGRLEL